MRTIGQDLKYSWRMLARNPGMALVMLLTLGLAIGANTAIFSVVYGVLLRPLPYPQPDRIVSMSEVAPDGHLMNFADPNFSDLRAQNHGFVGMAKCSSDEATVSVGSNPARVTVATVSGDFWRVMDVTPVLGRGFTADELKLGGTPAALVSYDYWRQHLGGSADLSSLKIKAEDHSFSVVGVLPRGFSFPAHSDLWLAAEFFGDQSPSRTSHNWPLVVARLRDGVGLEQARSEVSTLARRLNEQYKPNIDLTDVSVRPLQTALTSAVRPALLILLGAVGFLLLVGCANVANLLLANASARERELTIRAALGAGRGRMVRQFLIESLLLSLAGGALGMLAAIWGVDGLLSLAPRDLPHMSDISVSLPVLGFALGVSALVACGLGVLTAVRATAMNPQQGLGEGGFRQAGSIRSQRLGRFLVAGQLAITLVLLTGAGLLGRSLLRVLSTDPGFRTERVLTMELQVPPTPGAALFPATDTHAANFMSALIDRLRAIPGVSDVGGSSDLPLASEFVSDGKFLLLDRQPDFDLSKPSDLERLDRLWNTAPGGNADYCVTSEGYFRVLGIPLLRGRLFDERDTADASQAALISDSLARSVWPNQDPLGRTIEFGNMDGDMRLLTVVGVVGEVRDRSLEKPARPTVYVNYRQRLRGGRDFTLVMRSSMPPEALLAAARTVVRGLNPEVAPRFEAFQDVFSASLATRRFNLILVAAFAVTALLLAAVGIYGVIAYWVSRRTREIGVRIALGAVRADVLGLVLGQASKTTLVGVALGLAGAFALTRTMESLLFGVSAADPVTFAGVALLLAAVALIASYVPARRAAKVDPMVALRHE